MLDALTQHLLEVSLRTHSMRRLGRRVLAAGLDVTPLKKKKKAVELSRATAADSGCIVEVWLGGIKTVVLLIVAEFVKS